MNDNLSNRIWCAKNNSTDLPTTLTETEQTMIVYEIGKGCRQKTKDKLRRMVSLPLSLWNNYGIYSRMTFKNGLPEYICGQSWTDEMRTLRECLIK